MQTLRYANLNYLSKEGKNPIAKLCYKTDVMPHSENNYTGCNNKLRNSGPQNLRNQRNLRKTIFFFCKRRVNEIKEKLEELNTV